MRRSQFDITSYICQKVLHGDEVSEIWIKASDQTVRVLLF